MGCEREGGREEMFASISYNCHLTTAVANLVPSPFSFAREFLQGIFSVSLLVCFLVLLCSALLSISFISLLPPQPPSPNFIYFSSGMQTAELEQNAVYSEVK